MAAAGSKVLLLLAVVLAISQLRLVAAADDHTAAQQGQHDGGHQAGARASEAPLSVDSVDGRIQNMKVLHADARIFLFEGFLRPDECDAIVRLAEPRLAPSVIVHQAKSDAINGTHQVTSSFRTSNGMFFERGENAVVRAVEERIASWTLLPVVNGEGLQVLRYQHNQHYGAHWDFFHHKDGVTNGGNRYATVLTYLSDVEEGGETVFPFIPAPGGDNGPGYSECARKHLAVKPRKGDAILFHSVTPNGEFERRSQHQACPVIKGEKWSMAKWVHVSRYAIRHEPRGRVEQTIHPIPNEARECDDQEERCEGWALSGECGKNEAWMVGEPDAPGHCLFACRRCDVWKAHVAKHGQPPAASKAPQQPGAVATQKR